MPFGRLRPRRPIEPLTRISLRSDRRAAAARRVRAAAGAARPRVCASRTWSLCRAPRVASAGEGAVDIPWTLSSTVPRDRVLDAPGRGAAALRGLGDLRCRWTRSPPDSAGAVASGRPGAGPVGHQRVPGAVRARRGGADEPATRAVVAAAPPAPPRARRRAWHRRVRRPWHRRRPPCRGRRRRPHGQRCSGAGRCAQRTRRGPGAGCASGSPGRGGAGRTGSGCRAGDSRRRCSRRPRWPRAGGRNAGADSSAGAGRSAGRGCRCPPPAPAAPIAPPPSAPAKAAPAPIPRALAAPSAPAGRDRADDEESAALARALASVWSPLGAFDWQARRVGRRPLVSLRPPALARDAIDALAVRGRDPVERLARWPASSK